MAHIYIFVQRGM